MNHISASRFLSTVVDATNMADIETEYKSEIDELQTKYEERRKRRQSIVGLVTSTKNAKTITVTYQHPKFYPKYNTYISTKRKVMKP